MRMSERFPNILKQWAIFGGLLIVLHVLFFAAFVLFERNIRQTPNIVIPLVIVYGIGFIAIAVYFTRHVNRAFNPPELSEAQRDGIPAQAKVLDIERTRWRIKRRRDFSFKVHPTRFEYLMRVRVMPPNGEAYEATMAEYIAGAKLPNKGDVIPVKIHPQRPDLVVIPQDKPA